MIDSCTLWLPNAVKTSLAGASLAHTLYEQPTAILLSGELGSGKTTFLQGLAKSLGIHTRVTSPTFALEQRYQTAQGQTLVHADFYRLAPKQSAELLESARQHADILCIE